MTDEVRRYLHKAEHALEVAEDLLDIPGMDIFRHNALKICGINREKMGR